MDSYSAPLNWGTKDIWIEFYACQHSWHPEIHL
jgi:hypothetical protein